VDYVTAIVPTVGVLFLFVIAVRAIFQADRRERLAQAKAELQARSERPPQPGPRDSDGNQAAGGGAR
jgi:hypothetical protein